MMKRRLLIVEPSEVIVEGLKAILDGQIRFKVLEPESGIEYLEERITSTRPDILLINPTLVSNVRRFHGEHAMAMVALVYQYVERDELKQYDAVVDIRDSRAELIETLAQVALGEDEPVKNNYELTKRETAVLVQLAQGKTNKEIADALNVSVHTVISHRKNITHKTGIRSVAGLTVYAMLNNLIDESSLL
jgi:DNA-binding NarL/FixJ family response regulator